jgi:hypothetical protein
VDGRCVIDSGHSPSAVSADWFVFFAPDASGNRNGHRTAGAFVFVGRHSISFSLYLVRQLRHRDNGDDLGPMIIRKV